MPLKELEARFAKPRNRPFKLNDGEGLFLLVQPNGSKLWRMRCYAAGREKLLSFGKYPGVSLAAARQMRDNARATLDAGGEPVSARTAQRKLLDHRFEPIARAWHANRETSLDPAHAARVLARFERDVFPAIGDRPIAMIKPPEILAVIQSVEARGALDISRRLKQGIGQVFAYAIANGWADVDPTTSLNAALKPRPRVRHMPRIPLAELPAFLKAIQEYDGDETARRREITRLALRFTLLTWTRTREARLARWCEFEDLHTAEPLWRIPAERMKMRREHLVPLSRQVVDLLKVLRKDSVGEFVFPGVKPTSSISENTMIYACYRMGYRGRQTVHGFRGLASTWANETLRYGPDWIEMALAHIDEDEVRGAYNAALYLAPRRTMLQEWADFLSALESGQPYVPPANPVVSRASLPVAGEGTQFRVSYTLQAVPMMGMQLLRAVGPSSLR